MTPWTVWTVARQAPLSTEFSRQEYWSGLPFPLQPESGELFYLVGMFRTPKSGRQRLSISENTAPKRWEEESGYIQVCNKASRQAEHQRSGIRLRNLAFFEKMQASGLTECIPFICTSAIWGQILFPCSLLGLADGCFLHSPPPAPQQSPRGVMTSAGSQLWEP